MILKDFSGGLNTQEPAAELKVNEAVRADNCIIESGVLKSCTDKGDFKTIVQGKGIHSQYYFKNRQGLRRWITLTEGENLRYIEDGAPHTWDSVGWTKRVRIEFANPGVNTLESYPIGLTIPVEIRALSATIGGDFRFVSDTGTVLSHWIESWADGIVYVKTGDVPAASVYVFWLYVSNPNSNIFPESTNVFEYIEAPVELGGGDWTFSHTFPKVLSFKGQVAAILNIGELQARVRWEHWWGDRLGVALVMGSGTYRIWQAGDLVIGTFPASETFQHNVVYEVQMSFYGQTGWVTIINVPTGDIIGSTTFTHSQTIVVNSDFYATSGHMAEHNSYDWLGEPIYAWDGVGVPAETTAISYSNAETYPAIGGVQTLPIEFKKHTEFCTFVNDCVIVDPTQRVKRLTNVGISDLGGALWGARRGGFIAEHRDRIFMSMANSNRIWYNNAGLYLTDDDWKTDGIENFFDVPLPHGQKITGLSILFDTLIVFGEENIFYLSGSEPANWVLKQFDIQVGCIAPRSIVNIGDGIFFMSRDGIHFLQGRTISTPAMWSFDNVRAKSMSERIRPTFNSIKREAAKTLAQGIFYKDHYYLAVPIGLSEIVNDHVFVADVRRGSWTIRDGIQVASWLVHPITGKLYFGGYDGHIYEWESSANYLWGRYTTGLQDRNYPNSIKRLKSLWVTYLGKFAFTFIIDGVSTTTNTYSNMHTQDGVVIMPATPQQQRIPVPYGGKYLQYGLEFQGTIYEIEDDYELRRVR